MSITRSVEEKTLLQVAQTSIVFFVLSLLIWPSSLTAQPDISKLLVKGSVLAEKNGKRIIAINETLPLIPASTIKVLTSLVAIDSLGENYHFKTEFYIDEHNNLHIKGYGDPFLTSENITEIAKKLSSLGLTSINDLILDDFAFNLEHQVPGSENSPNPYDAQVSALAVNFNTLPIRISPNKLKSAETQTPFLPIMSEMAEYFPNGLQRINVDSQPLANTANNSLRYTAELFTASFLEQNIKINGTYKHSPVQKSKNITLFFTYYSEKSLAEMLNACLKYSNNFIANQIFLTIGMEKYGEPATWEKASRAVYAYIDSDLTFNSSELTMKEGSGLSRETKISANQMMEIMHKFMPYANSILTTKHSFLIKSGTLKGVYCYVGYLPYNDILHPFVLTLNQKKNNRDEILKEIVKTFTLN